MVATVQYIKKVGGSLMVRIPKEIAEIEQMGEGEPVQIEIHKVRKDWFGCLRGMTPMKKEEKIDLHE